MCSYIWFNIFFFLESIWFNKYYKKKKSINQINIQLRLHLNINKFTIKAIKVESNSNWQNLPQTL